MVMAMTPPIGGVATAISVAAPTAEGLMVYQYNGDYKLSDSIVMQGFRGGNFNMLWANAGVNGITMDADTLCTLLPGRPLLLPYLTGENMLSAMKKTGR